MFILSGISSDVRVALRQITRRPSYALACIAVLAFGLGTCTAVFSALYTTVLKPLPYPEPGGLVTVQNRFPHSPMQSVGASPADYFNLSRHQELFSGAGAYYFLDLSLSGIDVPRKINAVAISSSLFRVLGVQPLLGRVFSDVEQRYSGPHAAILSESYWEEAFGRDPQILHRSLKLNGELYPVIGVMPGSFAFPNDVTQMWTPMALRDPDDGKSFYLRMYARLAPGLDFGRGAERIAQISAQIASENPRLQSAAEGWSYSLTPMVRNNDPSIRRWLWILFAGVGCFLVVVCSNVAGLVLARSSEQKYGLAVRRALGASGWRIARQVLVDVLLLAGCGGIAGVAIARAGVALLARYGPASPPHMELPVFLFCAILSLLTGIICGVYPALHSAGSASLSVGGGLIAAGPRQTADRAGRRWQQGLLVIQVGVATTLLVCGGLLIHSLVLLLQTPPGFDATNVLTMYISLPPARYTTPESRARFFDAVVEQTSAIGAVDAASASTLLPFGYGENVNTFEIVDRPKPLVSQFADLSTVTADYFATMRIPLLRGRPFTRQDRFGTAPAMVVDETFARRFFAGEDPTGRRVRMPWGVYTIVGVVGSVKISGLDVDSPPTLYFSAAQSPVTDMTLVIRSNLPQKEIVADVQRIVAGIDRDQPVYDTTLLQQRIHRSLKTREFVVRLMMVFAAAGTLLAALGLFGLFSYTLSLRRREIGLRIALGAGGGSIAMLIIRSGMAVVAIGMGLGSGTALAAYRLISSQMYGVGIDDRMTWLAVLGILSFAGLSASALPAWRAVRLSPAEALKTE